MDRINSKWGRGTLRLGGVPVTPDWGCVGKCSAQATGPDRARQRPVATGATADSRSERDEPKPAPHRQVWPGFPR
nr:hypothetical protein [Pseudomonas aeruginosa]